MKNLCKIVIKRSKNGSLFLTQSDLFYQNDLAFQMADLASKANYNLVKVCRGNEIFELHQDKHNNYIYREYEKN